MTGAAGCGGAAAADGQFRLLADSAPVMIWRAGPDKARDFVNGPWLDFTGRSLEQELGFGWAEGVHPDDRPRCLETYARAFDAREPFATRYRLRRRDGAWRWVRDHGAPYPTPGGAFAGYVGSCADVTELHAATEARDTLLAELHHRVKNNAQATTSFLSLQASRAEHPAVAEALRGAAMRVMLAAQVQDRMFRLDAEAGVALGPELAATARAALEAAGRPGIAFAEQVEASPVVPASQATPLALMVSELVVNAARHAFPEGRRGTVTLAVRALPGGDAEVRVEDDGVGLPEAVRREAPRGALGLHLAPRLARQARASLRFEGPPGTAAVIIFRPG